MAILRKLPAAVAVAALTATLVGCGSSDVRDERDEALMERDEARAELEQTQTERDQAQTDLEAAQAERDQAQTDLETAQAEAEAAEQARMEAEQARMEAEQARMDEEQARMDEEQARMDEEAARMAAEEAREMAEGERDTLQEAADEAAAAAASATAKALLASLGDVDPDPVPTGGTAETDTRINPPAETFPVFMKMLYMNNVVATDGSLTSGDPATASATSGGDVGVSVTGYSETENVPDMIEGFRGVELMAKDRTLWIYTDIMDATAGTHEEKLDAMYRSTSAADKAKVYPMRAAAEDGNIPWENARRDDTMLVTTGLATETTAVHKFTGSVDGVPGTFSCTGANTACVAPMANRTDGGLSAESITATITGTAGWEFAPTDPDGTEAGDAKADTDYLAFGWWLHKRGATQPIDEQMNVAVFAQATGLTKRMADDTDDATTELAGTGTELTGSATYMGGAAGKYAMESTIEDTAQGGHFTAMAKFTANFDADADGDSADGNDRTGISLTGMIDNFMTGDMARDWTVELTYDDNTAATDVASRTTAMESPVALGDIMTGACTGANTCGVATATWDTGGASEGMGTWTASYYGGKKTTDIPTAVAGTFDATIREGVARIIGAFGATMMMDDM